MTEMTNQEIKTNDDHPDLYLEVNTGTIYETSSNTVMCRGMPTIENYTGQFELDCDCKYEYCEDGTVIRLYNYEGKWITATSKCLDAKNSYWSSNSSFDQLFWETFEGDTQSWDVEYSYNYILKHIDNRIVVPYSKNTLVYVNRVLTSTGQVDYIKSEIENIEVKETELDMYFRQDKRGIMIKKDNKLYKYDFSVYTAAKNIRGNVPQIRMRYLELLNNKELLECLVNTYAENKFLFAMVSHSLNVLAKNVHSLYIESHVKHIVQVYAPHPLYRTLKQLHADYKNKGTVITRDIVFNKICNLDKFVIAKMLKWVN